MRSGTSLISTFLGENKGVKILVDQARILAASEQAFKGYSVDFSAPMNLKDRMKLFESFVNVTLWVARNKGDKGMSIALGRLAPFMGYLRQIRSWSDRPHIKIGDILDLPPFRSHIDFFAVILEHSAKIANKPTITYVGNKETRGENFAQAMALDGKKSIIVIRDPRAVVSSLMEKIRLDPNFGVKSDADDAIKRWIKSYDVCKENPNIHMIRYEDFVQDHENSVARLAEYLDVDLKPGTGLLINNSSFADVQKGTLSEAGISRWRDYHDEALIRKVTRECRDQIEDLGYDI